MATKLISPRSGAKKVAETSIDLGVLATAIPVIFGWLKASGHQIPAELEIPTSTFIMALGGTLSRIIRHRRVYVSKR